MSHAARPATLAHPAPAPIPFRQSGGISGPEVFSSFAITLLLLAAVAGAAWYARKRGWLDKWLAVPASPGEAGKRRLAVVERLALSRRTTLIRVRDGERELLVLESAGTAHFVSPATELLK